MAEPPRPRVVVTGLGAVSPYGWGVEALWHGLLSAVSGLREFDRFDHTGYRTHVAGQVPPRPVPAAEPFAGDRMATVADRFALAATAEALSQARLPERLDDREVGIYFGCSTGGLLETEEFFSALTRRGHRRAPMHRLAAQQPGCPAEAVARALGVHGPVETVSSACASATLAIGKALEALREGEVDLALVGGADSLCRVTFAGFNSLRAVDSRPCRPFRADREGMSIGEGAGVLVLEREADARRRGAPLLAELAGAGASCDAHHMTAPQPCGSGVVRAIRAALADAGLAPEAIDFVNAHGTGTPLNDSAEWAALSAAFGERAGALPATSTKGCVGHYLGSAGAVEAVATVLCLLHRQVHPTPGDGEIDPAAPVDLVRGAPRPLPDHPIALSTNFAFGGANAAIVLGTA